MIRNLHDLADRAFDLVVVGGGAYGVSLAREAAQRGMAVALVEKRDFAHAASGNSFRMVHGGIRYIQHGDVARLRASARERRILLATAPHLVRPLPIAIPTYGHGARGKAFLMAGMKLYDALTPDRNKGVRDPEARIPPCRALTKRTTLDLFPGLEQKGLTGAGLFSDGQMLHPMRLALSILKSGVQAGAVAANYAEVVGFLGDESTVRGVRVRDRLTGGELDLRGRMVVNATGGWAERLLEETLGITPSVPRTFSRDLCLVVDRAPSHGTGVAVLGGTYDPDAMLSRSKRHLFVVPWRGKTLVGVWHVPYRRSPDDVRHTREEIRSFVDEVNRGYPGFSLDPGEVTAVNAGLVLFGENEKGAANLSYGKRSMAVDHRDAHGIDGLMTLIGVRWTTARADAAAVVDRLFTRDGRTPPPSRTHDTPVYGGDVEELSGLRQRVATHLPDLPAHHVESLCSLYGTEVDALIELIRADPALVECLPGSRVLAAEVVYAVRHEMACTLSDVAFRRTELATEGPPDPAAIRAAAGHMATAAGWDAARMRQEIDRFAEDVPGSRPLEPAGSRSDRSSVP